METKKDTKLRFENINKPAYLIFVLAGIYFLITGDFSQAMVFWGLAIVFDPFNPTIPFDKRPVYQKTWLFIHVAITLTLLGVMLWGK
ncbi:MAG: hypothetical protein H7Z13_02550 [Ferruginibacter sp.]|nr:hypothetical protein [Ferruginibacter sp.]